MNTHRESADAKEAYVYAALKEGRSVKSIQAELLGLFNKTAMRTNRIYAIKKAVADKLPIPPRKGRKKAEYVALKDAKPGDATGPMTTFVEKVEYEDLDPTKFIESARIGKNEDLQLKKPVKIRAPQKKQKPVEGAKARVSVKDPVTGEIKELGIVSNVSYETTNSDTLYPAPKPKTESKGFFDDEDE